MAFAMLLLSMLYMFYWNSLIHHVPLWATGGDLWGMYRGAQYVSWGSLGQIYTPSDAIVTLPGMPILLAPCAILSAKLHLTATYGVVLARPTVALILQPYEVLLSSTVVFAADALAERLGATQRHRIALSVLVAAIAWPTAAVWGHAEDVLAMTFALSAVIAVLDGKWSRCGWLLGFGVAVQPLVALLIPLLVGVAPAGRRLTFAVRSLALSAVLVGVALAGDPSNTYRALVKQPTSPVIDHATPWVAWAPRIPVPVHRPSAPSSVTIGGHVVQNSPHVAGADVLVAAGPGRLIYLVLAALVGVYVWRRPQSAIRLVWLAAVVLGMRCFFEAVMTPYYLAPPLILALLVVAVRGGKRFWVSLVIALGMTVWSYFHLSDWVWWFPIISGMTAILALSVPRDVVPERGEEVGYTSAGSDGHL